MILPDGATLCECCGGKGYLAPVKVCEHCGAEYRLQEGRTTTGTRRATGTKFCSRRCCNNASQKRRRAARSTTTEETP